MSVLVYGWGNFAARNVVHVRDTCESCGRRGYLKSYDGLRFFTLYYVPVIPLGRRYVMNECPSCHAGRMLSSSAWRAMRAEKVQPLLDAHAARPQDRSAAEAALGAVVACTDAEAFDGVAARIRQYFGQDPAMQLHLGRALAYFRRDEEALTALKIAAQGAATAEAHAALAAHLMEMGRIDEAADDVAEAVAAGGAEQAPLMLLQAQAYQATGEHDKALSVLEALAGNFPDAAPAEVARLSEMSQKQAKRGRRVPSAALTLGSTPPKPKPVLLAYAPLAIVPMAVLGGLGIYAGACVTAEPEHVYLLGGLSEPYEVLVNGKPYQVPAGVARRIDAPWGEIRIEPAPGGVPVQPASVTVAMPLLTRVFSQPVFVINPDRTGAIEWERAQYHENPDLAAEGEYRIHIGEAMHRLDAVDFMWQPLPETITLDSGATAVWKTSVTVLEEMDPYAAAFFFSQYTDPDALRTAVLEGLRLDPAQPEFVQMAAMMLQPEEALAALEPALALRPLFVNAHRMYQSVAESTGREAELVETYQALVVAEPESGDALYLLGRVTPVAAEANALFEQATRAPQPSAWGHHALAYHLANVGAFDDAFRHAREAARALPDESGVRILEEEMLMATGGYAELAARLRETWDANPELTYTSAALVRLYVLAGDESGAAAIETEAMKRTLVAAGVNVESPDVDWQRSQLKLARAEARGDAQAVLAVLETRTDSVSDQFYAALLRGDLDAASAILESDEGELGSNDYILAYAAAATAEQSEMAETRLALLLEVLRLGGNTVLASWLAADTAPTPDEIAAAPLMPYERRFALLALGARFADRREEHFALARKLNYDHAMPHLIIDRLTAPVAAP